LGRTIASVTQQVQGEEQRLLNYRRALPKKDQLLFDELFAFARGRTAAIAMAADPIPARVILLSMIIGLLSSYNALESRLVAAEEALAQARLNELPAAIRPPTLTGAALQQLPAAPDGQDSVCPP
jgi:hypothetical protein